MKPKFTFLLALLLLLLASPAPAQDASSTPRIRTVILTGLDGPFHDWRKTSAALKEELEKDSRFEVRIVTETPAWLETPEVFQTDVLVQHYVNWQTDGLRDAAKTNLLKYVNDGGGFAVLHFANGAFNPLTTGPAESDWPDYRRLFLQRAWVRTAGSTHDKYGPVRVVPTAFAHPITAGLAPFDTTDELYCRQVPIGEPQVEPLLTAFSKVTSQDEPLAWAFSRGKGRVFQSLLGHSEVSMRAAGEFHRRGIAWAAGREPVAGKSGATPAKP
jgi:type 1 glutamine amidotransferase